MTRQKQQNSRKQVEEKKPDARSDEIMQKKRRYRSDSKYRNELTFFF